MLTWIADNKEWLLSGIMPTLLVLIVGKVWKDKLASKQKIQSGSKSTNIQISGDVKINDKPRKKE